MNDSPPPSTGMTGCAWFVVIGFFLLSLAVPCLLPLNMVVIGIAAKMRD